MFHHVGSPVLEQFSSLSGIDAWSLLSSEDFACNSKMMNDHSLIVSDSHMDHPSFITMKTQGMEEVVLGSKDINHYFLNDSVSSELIVEHPVEVPNEDPYAEIILVPNTVIKQEDVIEGGEIVIGSSDGNEVVIDEDDDHIDVHLDHDNFTIGSSIDICSDQIEENAFDDTKLVIDMETESYSLEALPSVAFDCVDCGIVLKSRAALKKHIKSQHTKPRKNDKKKVTSLNNIKEEKYLTDKRYTCPSCAYSSRRRDKLDKHMEKHVLLDGVHPCGKRRHKPQALPQRHRHNAEEYRCPYCPYSCTVYKALRKHQKVHSSGNDTFTLKLSCKICGKDRSTELDMQKHMRKHKNDEHFLCDLCNFSSVQLKKIIQHRRMHTGEKPHLCPHCSYRSARRDNLRSHVRRMHKRQNMYIDTFNPNEETAVNIAY